MPDDNYNNVVVFLRKDKDGNDLLCAVNFSPNAYEGYRVGVPDHRQYKPVFNTDAEVFGGSGFGDDKPVRVHKKPSHGKDHSVELKIPPFGGVFLMGEGHYPKPRAKKPAKTAAVKAEKAVKASETAKTVKAPAKKKSAKTVKSAAKAVPNTKSAAKKPRKEKKETVQ